MENKFRFLVGRKFPWPLNRYFWFKISEEKFREKIRLFFVDGQNLEDVFEVMARSKGMEKITLRGEDGRLYRVELR